MTIARTHFHDATRPPRRHRVRSWLADWDPFNAASMLILAVALLAMVGVYLAAYYITTAAMAVWG